MSRMVLHLGAMAMAAALAGCGSTTLLDAPPAAPTLGITATDDERRAMLKQVKAKSFEKKDLLTTDEFKAIFEQVLQSYDEGVAEFLDLERVKPNTLGNHRMLIAQQPAH